MVQLFLSGMGRSSKRVFHGFTAVPLAVVLTLAFAGCGGDKACNTKERALSGDATGHAGVSPNALLEQSTELGVGVEWQMNPSFLQRGFSGRTRLKLTLKAAGDGFESNSSSDCSPYVGVPVQVRLATTDGVVTEAQGEGEVSSYLDGHRELEVLFAASEISGSIAPTNEADLIVRLSWLDELYEGSIVARVVHQGDARISVNQVEIGLIDSGKAGDERPEQDAGSGAPSVPLMEMEPEPVFPIGAGSVSATQSGPAAAGGADASVGAGSSTGAAASAVSDAGE